MFRQLFLFASLAWMALAIPTNTIKSNAASVYNYSPALASFYAAISDQITDLKSSSAYASGIATCEMSNAEANFPTAPTPLPSPSAGASLRHVMLGMGYQNYTCPTVANATASPTAIGAYAYLFNVSCIAANYPSILNTLPALAYQYPLNDSFYPTAGTVGETLSLVADFSYEPIDIIYSGLHTFMNLTVPRFNLDVDAGNDNGLVLAKKVANSTAWPNATQGAYGAVPYLALSSIEGTTDGYTNVYRMQTQGGNDPKNCSGYTGEFGIPYTATYWVYSL